MAFGLIIRDSAGNVMLDLSKRLGRIIGFVDTGAGTSGSVTGITQFNDGVPFFFTVPLSAEDKFYSPTVTISGTTLSWVFTNTIWAQATRIFYGIC